MKTLRRVSDFIYFSNLFISVCASALTLETYLLTGKEVRWDYLCFVFFATFFLYNFQRLFYSNKYFQESLSERHKWIFEKRKMLQALTIISVAGIVAPVLNFRIEIFLFLIPLGIISLAYFLPNINLRSIPGAKAIIVTLIWVAATAILPLVLTELNYKESIIDFRLIENNLLILLQRFFFLLSVAIVFNIRDISIDKNSGIKTLPIIFGVKTTKIICLVLLFLFCAVIPYPFSQTGIALVISAIITGIIIWNASEKRSEYFYSFWMDGMILLQAGLVFISTLL